MSGEVAWDASALQNQVLLPWCLFASGTGSWESRREHPPCSPLSGIPFGHAWAHPCLPNPSIRSMVMKDTELKAEDAAVKSTALDMLHGRPLRASPTRR